MKKYGVQNLHEQQKKELVEVKDRLKELQTEPLTKEASVEAGRLEGRQKDLEDEIGKTSTNSPA